MNGVVNTKGEKGKKLKNSVERRVMEIKITKKVTLQPDIELEVIEELCGEEE